MRIVEANEEAGAHFSARVLAGGCNVPAMLPIPSAHGVGRWVRTQRPESAHVDRLSCYGACGMSDRSVLLTTFRGGVFSESSANFIICGREG